MNKVICQWLFAMYILVACLMPATTFAQDNDFGLDFELGAEKKLAKGLKLGLEGNVRTQDNTTRIDRYGLGVDLSYKFFSTADKRWDAKVFGGFEYLWIQNLSTSEDKYYDDTDDLTNYASPDTPWQIGDVKGYNTLERYWRNRQRYSAGLSLGFTPNKRWSFSLKETFQYSHYNSVDSIGELKVRRKYNDDDKEYWKKSDDYEGKPSRHKTVLRSRLEAKYDIPMCKFDPFASVEYTAGLNYSTTKWKYTVGTDYKLSKTKKLSVFYRYNHEDDDDEPNGHLIGFSYNIDF